MVEYVSKSDLQTFSGKLSINEQATLRKNAQTASLSVAAFLSHSSKDTDLVAGAIVLLRNHGATVYTDQQDPAMPAYTTSETAHALKSRIRQCKKFILLATENSSNSKWVPWELGIADGIKGMSQIATFPAVDGGTKSNAWTSWEYMGLYKQIVRGKIKGDKENSWLVWDKSKNSAERLKNWLSA